MNNIIMTKNIATSFLILVIAILFLFVIQPIGIALAFLKHLYTILTTLSKANTQLIKASKSRGKDIKVKPSYFKFMILFDITKVFLQGIYVGFDYFVNVYKFGITSTKKNELNYIVNNRNSSKNYFNENKKYIQETIQYRINVEMFRTYVWGLAYVIMGLIALSFLGISGGLSVTMTTVLCFSIAILDFCIICNIESNIHTLKKIEKGLKEIDG